MTHKKLASHKRGNLRSGSRRLPQESRHTDTQRAHEASNSSYGLALLSLLFHGIVMPAASLSRLAVSKQFHVPNSNHPTDSHERVAHTTQRQNRLHTPSTPPHFSHTATKPSKKSNTAANKTQREAVSKSKIAIKKSAQQPSAAFARVRIFGINFIMRR